MATKGTQQSIYFPQRETVEELERIAARLPGASVSSIVSSLVDLALPTLRAAKKGKPIRIEGTLEVG